MAKLAFREGRRPPPQSTESRTPPTKKPTNVPSKQSKSASKEKPSQTSSNKNGKKCFIWSCCISLFDGSNRLTVMFSICY